MTGYEICMTMLLVTFAIYVISLTIIFLVPVILEIYRRENTNDAIDTTLDIIADFAEEKLLPLMFTTTVTTFVLWLIFGV